MYGFKVADISNLSEKKQQLEMWAELGKITYVEGRLQEKYKALGFPGKENKLKLLLDEKQLVDRRRQELNLKAVNYDKMRRKRKREDSSCSHWLVSL